MWIFWEMTSGIISITLSGSTVDACSASVYEAFWTFLTRLRREVGLESDPRVGPDDPKRDIFASFLIHFSPSVQLDVRARVAGTPGVLTPTLLSILFGPGFA